MTGTLLDDFESYVRSIRAERTSTQYRDCARDFLTFVGRSGWNAHALPKYALDRYVEQLSARYEPRSVRVHVCATNKFLHYLRRRGIRVEVDRNYDLPRPQSRLPDAMNAQQLAVYFEEMAKLADPFRTATTLLPLTGLRIHELVTRELGDIGAVRMRFGDRDDVATTLRVKGKGSRPRVLVLLPQGRQAFLAYLNWRRQIPGQWLFPSTAHWGHHVSDRWVREQVSSVGERLGVRITPHTMRRTYITALWRYGVDVSVIAKMTGHSVSTLMRHYLAPTAEDLARFVHQKVS